MAAPPSKRSFKTFVVLALTLILAWITATATPLPVSDPLLFSSSHQYLPLIQNPFIPPVLDHLLITELMADPLAGQVEWVEVYNPTAATVDLSGYKIGDEETIGGPEAMRQFARAQKVDDPNWAFLSATPEVMERLTVSVGFVYFPSPRGFDHINQVTLVDRDGVIYRQVYGADFDLPWLVEPLKELVFNRPQPAQHFVTGLVDRVRLFCTVYDPATGRYRFDYSLFVQIAVGGLIILAIAAWLLLEIIRARRRKRPV